MAIVVLVLWLLTAGAGFYLLVTSNLGRARPASWVYDGLCGLLPDRGRGRGAG